VKKKQDAFGVGAVSVCSAVNAAVVLAVICW
jgi:hypothetical protein